ncbi:hypothetical protein AV530_017171 [Patagioenas fasciata monilis]|uniref:Uncharacterized protein n=1 Tax=Patagioenas fasciata monilis TaxID=372326 RepID=A0A1V4JFJ3_PATFA|nr:hypothetical protein AV530_017171 [Patagioenas fasciata monilis]
MQRHGCGRLPAVLLALNRELTHQELLDATESEISGTANGLPEVHDRRERSCAPPVKQGQAQKPRQERVLREEAV